MAAGAKAPTASSRKSHAAWQTGALALLLAIYAATRIAAVFSVAANWDEFALLDRAAATAESGVLEGGGRPGLATLILVPFVEDCGDEIAALRAARLLWAGVTLCFLLGLATLLGRSCAASTQRRHDVWLGVALLAFVPAFLEWSVQVRSDQLALACGVWGAVALLASKRRVAWALVAGAIFATGFLATQKLVYVGALAVLLAVAELLRERDFQARRELLRATAVACVFVAVVAAFQVLTTATFEVPESERALTSLSTPTKIAAQMSEFDYYRNTIGYGQYLQILPTLVPHAVLLAGLIAATFAWARLRREAAVPLVVAWAVLALGLAIGAFHASAFAYFYMTLGLFPAVALAIAAPALRSAVPAERQQLVRIATIGVWAVLAIQGVARMAELTLDTQAVQRESLAFVHRNFDDDAIGFHPERAPFCRSEDAPLKQYFSQTIYRHFGGEHREHHSRQLLGRKLAGAAGDRSEIELIVPGRYRWLPIGEPRSVRVGETLMRAGQIADFGAGPLQVSFVEDVPAGMLVLALDEPPAIAPLAFYKSY
jgi:hypothetical protein